MNICRMRLRAGRPQDLAGTPFDIAIAAHPIALDDETIHERIMVIARNRGVAVHHLFVQTLADERMAVSLDLEVDGRMSLADAHAVASGLEAAIEAELGPGSEVETHIEPITVDRLTGLDLDAPSLAEIRGDLEAAAERGGIVGEIHHVRARATAEGVVVNFHCRAEPSIGVAELHAAIDDVERAVRARHLGVRRVIGHGEPKA